jgi:hypothetical protein
VHVVIRKFKALLAGEVEVESRRRRLADVESTIGKVIKIIIINVILYTPAGAAIKAYLGIIP